MIDLKTRTTLFHSRDVIPAFDTLIGRQTDALLSIDKILRLSSLDENTKALLEGVVTHIETAYLCSHECFGQFTGKRTYLELKQFLKDQEELEDERIYKNPKRLTNEQKEKNLQQALDIIKNYKAQRNKRPKTKRENS